MNYLSNFPSHTIRPVFNGKKTTRYRNNIVFTIGYDCFEQLQIGPLQLDKTVKPAHYNILCSSLALNICEVLHRYLLEVGSIPVYNPSTKTGFWRHIQIRENTEGEYLINFRVHNLDYYREIFENQRYLLVNYLNKNSQYQLMQINYQEIIGKKEPTSTDEIHSYFHKGQLYQNMLDKVFMIHPLCFFQINYETATYIFQKVRELVYTEVVNQKNNHHILLDLCCGVGIYSILLADLFHQVWGIDSNPCNIRVANEVKYRYYPHAAIEFVTDRVENQLPKIPESNNLTAIINPSRSGIPLKLTEYLKENLERFDQIIYVSCNPETLVRDLKILEIRDYQFLDVIPVNQFPQTEELEVIVNLKIKGGNQS